MAYNQNIPQAGDKLNKSQGDLLENFQQIDAWVQQDHVGFGPNQGKHSTARFVDQSSAPTVNSPETAFFNAQPNNLGGLTISQQEMYVRSQNNGSFRNIPFTASILSTNATSNGDEGWCYLASGIIMKWGTFGMSSAGAEVHDYPTGTDIPPFSKIYSLQVTVANPTVAKNWAAMIVSYSVSNFTVYVFNTTSGNDRQAEIHYIAIGS